MLFLHFSFNSLSLLEIQLFVFQAKFTQQDSQEPIFLLTKVFEESILKKRKEEERFNKQLNRQLI